ncbi:hypothetical protein CLOM_g22543 [Closterium sp. NIES-68]|nr:hypothetical protein CLOM_g22543 [Closterium sp. NIES-68]GJP72712.1 hypothetical protein CLOP_g3469 [Closterium sp. NIES-67]
MGMGMEHYDVVVVGAGIMGSCAAYELAKRGRSVLLLEQFDLLHRRGSSHGESRIIRRTYPEDHYTALMPLAYALWESASNEAGYSPLTVTGGLDFGPRTNSDLAAVLASCCNHGVPHQLLEGAALRERFPMLDFPDGSDSDLVGVFCPDAGVLHATKSVAMFQQLAARHGAALRDKTAVTAIEPLQDKEAATGVDDCVDGGDAARIHVVTSKGSVTCNDCVVAAGAWAGKLLERATGRKLPLEPLRTTVAYWRVAGEGGADADCAPAAAAAAGDSAAAGNAATAASDGGACSSSSSGSTSKGSSTTIPLFINYDEPYVYGIPSLEFPDLIKVSLHSGLPCPDPDNRPSLPDAHAARTVLVPWLQARFGNRVTTEPVMMESCLYTMTPDQDFIIDRIPLASGKGEQVAEESQERDAKLVLGDGEQGDGAGEESPGEVVGRGVNIVVAAGFSGHGFKFGPLVGKMAADLVMGHADGTTGGVSSISGIGGFSGVKLDDGEENEAGNLGSDVLEMVKCGVVPSLFSYRRFLKGGQGNLKACGPQVRPVGDGKLLMGGTGTGY